MNVRVCQLQSWSKLMFSFTGAALCVAILSVAVVAQPAYKFDAATVSGLPARNIGSAVMSGRIAAIDAVEEKGRLTVFVGAATGGLWKSVNGGTTYKPVFDRENLQSIGAVGPFPIVLDTIPAGVARQESMVQGTMDFYTTLTSGGESAASVRFVRPDGRALPSALSPQVGVFRLPQP